MRKISATVIIKNAKQLVTLDNPQLIGPRSGESMCVLGRRELLDSGVRDSQQILAELTAIIEAPPSVSLEYANIVNSQTLEELPQADGEVLIAVAAKAGSTRLIDNILVDVSPQSDTMTT